MKKIVFTMVLAFLLCNGLQSQIAFTGSAGANSGNTITLSQNISIPAGNNVVLIVGVTAKEDNITGVTFAGTAMNQLTVVTQAIRVGLFYKVMGNLSSNLNGNVVVSLSNSDQVCMGAAFYSGVSQTSPLINTTVNKGQSTSATLTFSNSTGNLGISLIGALVANANNFGAGQTSRWAVVNNHSNRLTEEPGAATNTMSYTLSSSSDWAMIGAALQASNIALDIDLKDFYVNCYDNYFQLDWSTATEKNTDYFKVQRSLNMLEWVELAKVKAAGNTVLTQKYSYRDEFDALSPVYYRLIEVDLDKSEKVLPVRSVVCANSVVHDDVWIYPNPSKNTFMLNFKLSQLYGLSELVVQDNLGRIQYREMIDLDNLRFNKLINHNLVAGLYHITITTNDGKCLKKLSFLAQ